MEVVELEANGGTNSLDLAMEGAKLEDERAEGG